MIPMKAVVADVELKRPRAGQRAVAAAGEAGPSPRAVAGASHAGIAADDSEMSGAHAN